MFELVKGTQAASLYIAKEADDFAGLSHVAEKIQKDIELVTGVAPKICDAMPEGYSIIPGTIGKNPVIDEMIANGKLNVSQLDGKRESYTICLVDGDKLTGDPKSGIYFFCDFSSCTGVISDYAFSPEVKAAFPDTEFIEV